MSGPSSIENLIARHLDGTAGPAEAAELDLAVRSDPEAAKAFARAALLDAGLRQLHRTAEVTAGGITARIAIAERRAAQRSARRTAPRRRRSRLLAFPLLLASAAALLVAVGAVVWLRQPASGPFTVAGRQVVAGSALHGAVGIAGGGSIELSTDAVAMAAGDARDPVLRLVAGQVRCEVAPRGEGAFHVETPHGGLRVLGTIFQVAVAENTRLRVERGLVEATAGGIAERVGAGGMALIAPGRPPEAYQAAARLLPTSDLAAWNNNSKGVTVVVAGDGPTGQPALRLDLSARSALWASCVWRPGVDWRDFAGVSLVMEGRGTGAKLQLEIMDNGPASVSGKRDAYERFLVEFQDDRVGWHERRFHFAAFRRRQDLWPGMPDDGFGRDAVHGFSIIAHAPWQGRIERVALFVND